MDNNNQMGTSLIDNFEASFMNCIHSFTKQESAIDVDKGNDLKHQNLIDLKLFLILPFR